jgi:regulatory protein
MSEKGQRPQPSAWSKALTLLARRAHSVRELEVKLRQKGYAGEEIAEALTQLLERNYLNDEEFARSYCQCKCRKHSRRRVEVDLLSRGVARETVQAVLEAEYSAAQEVENCKRTLAKKDTEDKAAAARAASFLHRQGYRGDSVRAAFTEVR